MSILGVPRHSEGALDRTCRVDEGLQKEQVMSKLQPEDKEELIGGGAGAYR